jgi:dTDP-4-amino-4,6-dideoxygalactose transaminase
MWSYKDHGKNWEAVHEHKHPPGFRWVHDSFGTNWRMLEMQAAIGRIQLGKVADWTKRRNANARAIAETCKKYGVVRIPEFRCSAQCSPNCATAKKCEHAYYRLYVYVVSAELASGWNRDRIVDEISRLGVHCYQGSCSEVYLEKAFDGTGWRPKLPLRNARELGETALAFLVHPTLTKVEMKSVCKAIESILQFACRST